MPEVTPAAIDDAIETIRKRTDSLGVSEPEIQRAGANQISIGLPDVENADRAIEQVGTTAQLQFYDWEPNVLGDRGPDAPFSGSKALFQAVELASKSKPKAEQTDIPPGAPDVAHEGAGRPPERHRRRPSYYLFGPDQKLIAGPDASCEELLADFEGVARPRAHGAGHPEGQRVHEGAGRGPGRQGEAGRPRRPAPSRTPVRRPAARCSRCRRASS